MIKYKKNHINYCKSNKNNKGNHIEKSNNNNYKINIKYSKSNTSKHKVIIIKLITKIKD